MTRKEHERTSPFADPKAIVGGSSALLKLRILVVVGLAFVSAGSWGQLKPCMEASSRKGAAQSHGVSTFSILGYDGVTRELGGAVQSRVFAVGNGVLWLEADVGAVATQAYIDVGYGPAALALLRQGYRPGDVVKKVWDNDPDPHPQDWPKSGRQFAVMNANGESAAFTGVRASAWAGHRTGVGCSAQGSLLAGEGVVAAMLQACESTQGPLALRLLAALEAGQRAGGDKRGMQSAAMIIVKKGGGIWLNSDTVLRLQVDDHEEPIKELRRLVQKGLAWNEQAAASR